MIAELFYPKELKEVIKDLREKDDLNEEALHFYHMHGLKIAFIIWVIAGIFISFNELNFGILALLLSPVICFIDLRSVFFKQMAAYIYGTKRKGTVTQNKIILKGQAVGRIISCQDNDNPKKPLIKIGPIYAPLNDMMGSSKYPDIGESIDYYHDANGKYTTMPHLDFLMKKYCLVNSKRRK